LLHMKAMHLKEVFAYLYQNDLNFSNCVPLISIEVDSNAMMTDVMNIFHENFQYMDKLFALFIDHSVPQELDLSSSLVTSI